MTPSTSCSTSDNTRGLLGIALATALCMRITALVFQGDISQSAPIWEYGEQAQCALKTSGQLCLYYSAGSGDSYPSAYVPPLLSYFWLALFHLFGDGSAARAVWLGANVAAALGSVALIFRLTYRLWPSRRAAFSAAMLLATYPTFVYVSVVYHQTNWAVLLLLSVTAVAVKLAQGTDLVRYGVLGGILCGIAALNRSEMLIAGPILIALGALWGRRGSFVFKAGAASALTMTLILTPWTLMNYQEFSRLVVVAQSTGYNLWKGYNPLTNGSGNMSDDPNAPGRKARTVIYESVPRGTDYEARLQDAYVNAFKHDVRAASPERIIGLTVTKVALLWGYEWTDKETTGRPAYLIPWFVTNVLAIVGLITIGRRRHFLQLAPASIYAAAAALLTLAYAATCVHTRYRMHIEPYIFILAGIGIDAFCTKVQAYLNRKSDFEAVVNYNAD